MESCSQDCLRLDDDFGTKRWLTTRREAWRLMADGAYECEQIRPMTLESNLRRLVDPGNSSSGLRRFVMRVEAQAALGGARLHREDDILPLVMAAVRSGWLVVIRQAGEVAAGAATQARAEARRIAREIDTLAKGKLRCSGRRYTLCAQGQFDRSALGLTRRLLLPREARIILDRMVDEYAAQRELVGLLTEAKRFLAKGIRSDEADLILLRHLIQPQARNTEEAPVTPSQIRRQKEGWIETEVFDDADQPLKLDLRAVLPDGTATVVQTDVMGFARLDNIEPGDVQLSRVVPKPGVHVVADGECMTSIAYAYGISDPKLLFEHGDNAEIRQKRANPDLLYPGDEITIPEMKPEVFQRATGRRHRLVIKRPRRTVSLTVYGDDGLPIKAGRAEIRFDGGSVAGTIGDKGKVDFAVPIDVRDVILVVQDIEVPLLIGHLNPMRETEDGGISGAQARLLNLGFAPGAVDGIVGRKTRAAIGRFQAAYGLPVTRELDERTVKALEDTHGC